MQLNEKPSKRLVEQPDEFDLQMVRSALEFYNATNSDLADSTQAPVTSAFGWVPPVLEQRAVEAGIDPALVRWKAKPPLTDIAVALSVLLFQLGAFRDSLKQLGQITLGTRRLSAQQWYEEISKSIKFETHLTSKAGKTQLVTVPALTGLRQCVAYAVAVVRIRKLDALVRPCPYLRNDFPGSLAHHYFLADDLRQKFCGAKHSNLFRQIAWQKKHGRPQDKRRLGRKPK